MTGQFLPWHRAYVKAFETALQEKCGYTGTQPYWDWSLHAEDFFNSDPIFSPSTTGFGGNGDPENDFQITDGGFVNDFAVAYPVPHHVRRNFTTKPWIDFAGSVLASGELLPIDENKMANTSFSTEEVRKLVEGFEGDFDGFQQYFEAFQVEVPESAYSVQF